MTDKHNPEQDKKMLEARRAYAENARSIFNEINHLQWYKKEKLDQIRSGKLKQ
jgi:hypothetical protein